MPVPIPDKFKDLLQKKAFAQVATIMPDGSPQVTPVWFDYDGAYIRINSAKGRIKDRNIRRDPRVALDIQDPDNAYRHMQIRGRVVEITEVDANEHIDSLSFKYQGVRPYGGYRPGMVRVTYVIEPLHISTMG